MDHQMWCVEITSVEDGETNTYQAWYTFEWLTNRLFPYLARTGKAWRVIGETA